MQAAVTFGNVTVSSSSQQVGILQRWREWHGGTVQKTNPVRIREVEFCLAEGERGQTAGPCQGGNCFPFCLDYGSRRSKLDLDTNFPVVLDDILSKVKT